MRWSIVGLILVGVLAALSASLLVASLTTRGRAQNGGEPHKPRSCWPHASWRQ